MQPPSPDPNQDALNIVVLGGSYGGVSVAHSLLKHTVPLLSKYGAYRVVLLSLSTEILCRPACPRAMISDKIFDQSKLFVHTDRVFEQYQQQHFSFIHGRTASVDPGTRTVAIDVVGAGRQSIIYHALVIATGASTPSPLLSMNGDAGELRATWQQFRTALKQAKGVVIAGGGPAGVETAAELAEHLRGRAKITIISSSKQVLPLLRPELAAKAEKILTNLDVAVVKGVHVESVDPDGAGAIAALTSPARLTLSNGETLDADIFIPATGTTPNTSCLPRSWLAADGRIDTDTQSLRAIHAGPRVYAIGDASSYARPAIHNILEAVPVLSRNLKHDLLSYAHGDSQSSPQHTVGTAFKPDDGETQLVPIGTKGGVGAMKGWKLPSWVVWAIKGRDYWLWTTPKLWSGRQWTKEG